MVTVPRLPHAEFGRNDHLECAFHFILRRNPYQMNSIQCNIFHHQVAGTLSLDISDQMMVHCHQHDCSIEFRPLLAVLLLLHNIEIDFSDTDHHRSIFALVGIKNRGIFQI